MLNRLRACLLMVICAQVQVPVAMAENAVPASPNGIQLPAGYEDWGVISVSHRTDNNTLRVILGNEIAVVAARSPGKLSWPDGSALAKLVWKETSHGEWAAAAVPGAFVHAEFMLRDRQRYPFTGGWGFARWVGSEQEPYGDDEKFDRECFGCHQQVANTDYVFTQPVLRSKLDIPSSPVAD